ncbi:MAG TPA: HTTM domain-containing protein [Thermoanaerobaculia bacterium]|nr:HTTM domain-containing protein [Thermoanaerobaculia bacterium]
MSDLAAPAPSAPEDARALAVLRIGTAAVLLVQAAAVGGHLLPFVSDRGIVQAPINAALVHWGLPSLRWLYPPAAAAGLDEAQVTWSCLGIHMLALSLLLAGWRTRVSAASSWLTYLLLKTGGASSAYGAYEFGQIALFYCVALPVGAAASVDSLRATASTVDPFTAALSRFVLRAHLSIAYLSSGLAKAAGTQWRDGEAVWRALMRPSTAPVDFSWLASAPWLPTAMGWSVVAVEIGYVALAWSRRTRPWLLGAVFAMHLGIAMTLGLWIFSAVMLVLNAAALAEGPKYRGGKEPARA